MFLFLLVLLLLFLHGRHLEWFALVPYLTHLPPEVLILTIFKALKNYLAVHCGLHIF